MTGHDLLTPALIAALALNVVSIIWVNHAASAVPLANSRPPPATTQRCVEPASYQHTHR